MGCTREEFLGWLPGAVRGAAVELDGDLIRIACAGGEVRIRIAAAPERKLGRLSLPVLRVSLEFCNVGELPRDDFLRHFDLFMRRGGG
jgi:hypothetical protein